MILPPIITVATVLIGYKLFFREKHAAFIVTMILGAVVLRLLYLTYTDYQTRTHDVPGHLDYIMYVANKASLPNSGFCWECYQPPLYYFYSGLIYKTSNILMPNEQNMAYLNLQIFSLINNIIFLFIGIMTLRLFCTTNRIFILTSTIFAFWPSLVLASARIGNDNLLYVFYSLAYFFLTKWYYKEKSRYFLLAGAMAAAGLLTKSNALLIVAVFFSVYLFKTISKRKILYPLPTLLIICIISLITVFTIKRNLASSIKYDWLVGNSPNLNAALLLNRDFTNFSFHLNHFMQNTNIDPWRDSSGRQYFWNYLLKTSLFGEWPIKGGISCVLAMLLSINLLLIIILTLSQFHRSITNPLLYPAIIIPITGLIFLRFQYPYACANDFRYIVPIIIPFLGILGLLKVKSRFIIAVEFLILTSFIILSISLIAFAYIYPF